MIALRLGDWKKPKPVPQIIIRQDDARKSQGGRAASRSEPGRSPRMPSPMPPRIAGGKRSDSGPAIGAAMAVITGHGVSSNPVSTALQSQHGLKIEGQGDERETLRGERAQRGQRRQREHRPLVTGQPAASAPAIRAADGSRAPPDSERDAKCSQGDAEGWRCGRPRRCRRSGSRTSLRSARRYRSRTGGLARLVSGSARKASTKAMMPSGTLTANSHCQDAQRQDRRGDGRADRGGDGDHQGIVADAPPE